MEGSSKDAHNQNTWQHGRHHALKALPLAQAGPVDAGRVCCDGIVMPIAALDVHLMVFRNDGKNRGLNRPAFARVSSRSGSYPGQVFRRLSRQNACKLGGNIIGHGCF